MNRFLAVFLVCLLALPVRGAVPPLLEEAIGKLGINFDHWAYTETFVAKNAKGKAVNRAVWRFDPSKPFAEQFTVLSVDGRPPTAKEIKDYKKIGEERLKHIEEAEKAGNSAPRQTLGELMVLDEATLVSDDGTTATFEVPLKKEGNLKLPPDKFRVLVHVNKARGAFDGIDCTLRRPYRMLLLGKVSDGEGHLRYSTIDPKYPPVLTSIAGSGALRVVFVRFYRSYEMRRTEFQRVTPYSDRFRVKLGPLKMIDF